MIISYGQEEFELTADEFSKFQVALNKAKMVWIPRLEVFLTDKFIWAGKRPPNKNIRVLHDGSKAIKKFGQWFSASQPDVKIDLKYYPELLKDIDIDEQKRLK